MSTFLNIQRALDKRLAAMPNRPAIAWPNTKFTSQNETLYLRPTMLPAQSSLYTLNDVHRNPGIYQIDIFCALEKGVSAALTMADEIIDFFEEDRSLTAGVDTVYIQSCGVSAGERQESWYRVYVEIAYVCFS